MREAFHLRFTGFISTYCGGKTKPGDVRAYFRDVNGDVYCWDTRLKPESILHTLKEGQHYTIVCRVVSFEVLTNSRRIYIKNVKVLNDQLEPKT